MISRFNRLFARAVSSAANGKPDFASETSRPCREVTFLISKWYHMSTQPFPDVTTLLLLIKLSLQPRPPQQS